MISSCIHLIFIKYDQHSNSSPVFLPAPWNRIQQQGQCPAPPGYWKRVFFFVKRACFHDPFSFAINIQEHVLLFKFTKNVQSRQAFL